MNQHKRRANRPRRILRPALLLLLSAAGPAARADQPDAADAADAGLFRKGDHVAIVGNTFAERMGLFNYFETLLHTALPDHNLTVRILAWSADRAAAQPRPLNFGDTHRHLTGQKADVILICFGMTESFGGTEALPAFENDLRKFSLSLLEHRYNGQSPPRLAFVSPIAHEDLGDPLPDPTYHNQSLRQYAASVGKVAAELEAPFVDLFTPTAALMGDERGENLTLNGIHLTGYGYWATGRLLAERLDLTGPGWRIELDASAGRAQARGVSVGQVQSVGGKLSFRVDELNLPSPPAPSDTKVHDKLASRLPSVVVGNLRPGRYTLKINGKPVATADHRGWAAGVFLSSTPSTDTAERLRLAIGKKNEQFFLRWRAVNGEYIYGRRAWPFGVVNFPEEMKKIDELLGEHDRRIWKRSASPGPQAFELVPANE